MKKLFEIALGIVTSVGGYLEIGSIVTSAEAGAGFRFKLIWCLLLGTFCLIFLVEMAGRFAAISRHTITDAIRERFGFNFFLGVLTVSFLVNLLVLAAEIGGVAIAAELATGIGFQWWAVPAALLCWGLIWFGNFGLIEKGVSVLGLVTLCFVTGAIFLGPDWGEVARGAVPSVPEGNLAHYAFIGVSILGATISPYLYLFYSSGAVEDKWDESYLGVNRATAGLGMGFGGLIAIAVLILAGLVFAPQGIASADTYQRLPLLLTEAFGYPGLVLFVVSLAIACLGASLELSLQQAYLVAQGFGWNWGEDLKPSDNPGFSAVYSLAIFASAILMVLGLDPLKLTNFSMALTAASLPLTIVPMLFLMNDERYVKDRRNGWIGNAAVIFVIALGFVLAVVSIPLEIFGQS